MMSKTRTAIGQTTKYRGIFYFYFCIASYLCAWLPLFSQQLHFIFIFVRTAKHYSVTPLGAHSGLISWVDGMTPIFALYKKWQQRQATSPKKEKTAANTPSTKAAAATTKNTPPPVIPRPSELYFQKLTPLLSKHNLKATQNSRKEWPLDVLKQVLAELTGKCFSFHLFLFTLSSLDCVYLIWY